MSPIKVLHIIPQLSTGGAETLLIDTVSKHDTNFDVSICCFYDKGELYHIAEQKGIKIFNFNSSHNKISQVINTVKLCAYINKNKYQIVHIHLMLKHVFLFKLFTKKCKLICTLHLNIEYPKLLLRQFNHIIACGKELYDTQIQNISNITLVRNAIDPTRVLSNESKELIQSEFNLHNSIFILSVGRYSLQKNFTFLLSAFSDFLKKSHEKNYTLLIAGDGPERSHLEKLISDLSLGSNVKLLGNVKYIGKLYALASLYVNTSLYEGLSMTLIEAMVNKLPMLISNVPGNRELYDHTMNNLMLYQENDQGDFVSKLIELTNSNDLSIEYGQRAYTYYNKYHSVEVFIKEVESVYMKTYNYKRKIS